MSFFQQDTAAAHDADFCVYCLWSVFGDN